MMRILSIALLLTWTACGSDNPASPEEKLAGIWSGVAEGEVESVHSELQMTFNFFKDATFMLDMITTTTIGDLATSSEDKFTGTYDVPREGVLRLRCDDGSAKVYDYVLAGDVLTLSFVGRLTEIYESIRLLRG